MAVRSPPKATLFCPGCSRQGHVTGDWERVTTRWAVRLVCPECETTVTTRREQPGLPRHRA